VTRLAWAGVVAGGLAALAGCQSAPEHLTIKRDLRKEEWRALSRELDRPPIYAFSAAWEPTYQGAIELGLRPRRVRKLLRECARIGVSLEIVSRLFEEAKTGRELDTALQLAVAEARDLRRISQREEVSGYVHVAHNLVDAADREWDRTAGRIERFPILTSPLLWEDHFDDMIQIGLTPQAAGKNIVRATRLGASSEAFGKLLARHAADPAALQRALDLRCAELTAKLRSWDTGTYSFMRGEKGAKVKEEPKVAEITGKGAASAFDVVALDPAVLEVAGVEARLVAQKPGAVFESLAAGLGELVGQGWAQAGVAGASEAQVRRAAGRAKNLGQLVRGFDGGVVAQAVAVEGGAVRILALRMATAQDATVMLEALEASSRAQDDESAERGGPIESADYEAPGVDVAAGFLVTKTVAHGAGEYTDVGLLAVRSGAFVVQTSVIYGPATLAVARDAEQLRSFVEQVLAALPQ